MGCGTGSRCLLCGTSAGFLLYCNHNRMVITTETRRMWNVKAKLMSVITGATGTISKSLRQHLTNKTEKRSTETAILDAEH
jgi:hypothetical protein